MNASDDRNAEAFQLQLEAATQMRSVLSSKPEPNCLVIDEIDGAPAVIWCFAFKCGSQLSNVIYV